jgi:hypothetical protein
MKRLALLSLAAVIMLGCEDAQRPAAPTQSFAVSDGSDFGGHTGNPHFFFLPPLVPSPSYSGTFDSSLLPFLSVEIAGPFAGDASDASCDAPVQKTYTSANGLSVDPTTQQYAVGWQTGKDFSIQSGAVYRVCVRLKPTASANFVLGFRDTKASQGGGSVAEDPIYLFNTGSNLAIKFRAEEGILTSEYCNFNNVLDCTAAVVSPTGGTATCRDATCGLSVPQGALEEPELFVIERPACTRDASGPQGTDGKYAVKELAIDNPQFGGCLRVTVNDPTWTGFTVDPNNIVTFPTLGACFVNDGPYKITDLSQEPALQLHMQRESDLATVALSQAAAPFLTCTGSEMARLAPDASLLERLAYYARKGLNRVERAFVPSAAYAFHTGFGGSTSLTSEEIGPSPSAAKPGLAAGLSLQVSSVPGAKVFRLAWALPAQMEKTEWVDPVIGEVGQVVTAKVRVTDNGLGESANDEPTWGTPRPVYGAVVHFLPPAGGSTTPVTAVTGTDGVASTQWTLTPAGSIQLRASGYGIGLTGTIGVDGHSGVFADHFTREVLLDTGRVYFQAFACSATSPGLTSATVDGHWSAAEYANAFDTTVVVNLGGNNSSTATFYMGNDCQNLYLALVVGLDESNNNGVRFVFDNTPPAGESADDDVLSLSKISAGNWLFRDRFLSQTCVGSKQADCGPDDTSAGGTKDGAGAAAYDASIGKFVYEIRHPLKSGDAAHDFQRAIAQQLGAYWAAFLGNGSKGNTEWPDQKGNFKNYYIYTVKGPTITP